MNSYPYQMYTHFCNAGVCFVTWRLSSKAALTVFLPLTWMTSSLLGSLLLHSVPGMKGLWKVICLAAQLMASPLPGRNWSEIQNLGPPCSYWLWICVLAGSPGDSYARWRLKYAHSRSFVAFEPNWAQRTGRSPLANFRSFIVCSIWVFGRKGEIYSFKEVLHSIAKLPTS